ncbi:hypothetical protein C8J55DRAFT_546237 [Lentinula edodes]|uniref:Uncharacterized protein n=1 Tax=Lentinula lateritia TaxID=40482 RepID=A0A9W9B0I0_9AGAR|nr:hypothetical protein C8J55DRAFT_546237 [Lentinula edodes]
MPKSDDSATLRYIRRQTRRLTSSMTTWISGPRDSGSSAIASPRDEVHSKEYEGSHSAVEDTGSIQDSTSNSDFVDSTEPVVDCVERDPVGTIFQSQTDSKEGASDQIASSSLLTEPINPDAPVTPPEMIMTISTRGPVGQVAQVDVADNLPSTGAPVATTDPKPENQVATPPFSSSYMPTISYHSSGKAISRNTLQEGSEETVQLRRAQEGSVQSSNTVPSRLREITSSYRDEQPESKETIVLFPSASRLPLRNAYGITAHTSTPVDDVQCSRLAVPAGASSSYRGAIIGSSQNTVALSPSILSSHTAPAPSSSSEHTLTQSSTADIATVIDSDAPNVSSSYTDNVALVSVTTPVFKSDADAGPSCSTASSGLEVKSGTRSSNSVDISSGFSMASVPTCITGSAASSSTLRPSVTPNPSHTANSQAESDQPNNPAPSPGLDLSNTSPPSATKGRVRQLSEIAHLPAFYGSNDVVRMNWRKGYGAYEGQTALPTWNPVTKQWQHPRTASVVSASAAPVCAIPVKSSASALAASVMTTNPALTLSVTAIASSTSREGLPSIKSSTLQQKKVQVKTAHTAVKNAQAGTSHAPTITEIVSPSPRRSVRIAHSATFPRVSVPSLESAVVMPLLRKRPRETEDGDVMSEDNASSGSGESASKKVKRNAGRVNTKIPTRKRLMRQ